MKKIFCFCLLSLMVFAVEFRNNLGDSSTHPGNHVQPLGRQAPDFSWHGNAWDNDRATQAINQMADSLNNIAKREQYYQQQIQMQKEAQMQMQMRIVEYKKIYETTHKEKQLDQCANQLVAEDSGKKANLKFCLNYLNPNQ